MYDTIPLCFGTQHQLSAKGMVADFRLCGLLFDRKGFYLIGCLVDADPTLHLQVLRVLAALQDCLWWKNLSSPWCLPALGADCTWKLVDVPAEALQPPQKVNPAPVFPMARQRLHLDFFLCSFLFSCFCFFFPFFLRKYCFTVFTLVSIPHECHPHRHSQKYYPSLVSTQDKPLQSYLLSDWHSCTP